MELVQLLSSMVQIMSLCPHGGVMDSFAVWSILSSGLALVAFGGNIWVYGKTSIWQLDRLQFVSLLE